MTRKQAKIFARIHSAVMLSCIDGFALMPSINSSSSPVPEKDQDKMIEEVNKIASKIQGDLPKFSNSIDIYNHVIQNY